jgi:hypothetical protein
MFKANDLVRLKRIPFDLLEGLPFEDQEAIKRATTMTYVGVRDDGKAELEFTTEKGDGHTIWVDPAVVLG